MHGRPAGDVALISFAAVCSVNRRDGDLVARYGGEEFLLLTATCENAAAAGRAESIRQAVEHTSIASLRGDFVTSSFALRNSSRTIPTKRFWKELTELYLKPKPNGPNRVIRLGSGSVAIPRQSAPREVGKGGLNLRLIQEKLSWM